MKGESIYSVTPWSTWATSPDIKSGFGVYAQYPTKY